MKMKKMSKQKQQPCCPAWLIEQVRRVRELATKRQTNKKAPPWIVPASLRPGCHKHDAFDLNIPKGLIQSSDEEANQ